METEDTRSSGIGGKTPEVRVYAIPQYVCYHEEEGKECRGGRKLNPLIACTCYLVVMRY